MVIAKYILKKRINKNCFLWFYFFTRGFSFFLSNCILNHIWDIGLLFGSSSKLDSYVVHWGSNSKHHKDTCLSRLDHVFEFINYSTLTRGNNWEGLWFELRSKKNCALSITIIKLGEVGVLIRFILTLHHTFANASQVLLCKSN